MEKFPRKFFLLFAVFFHFPRHHIMKFCSVDNCNFWQAKRSGDYWEWISKSLKGTRQMFCNIMLMSRPAKKFNFLFDKMKKELQTEFHLVAPFFCRSKLWENRKTFSFSFFLLLVTVLWVRASLCLVYAIFPFAFFTPPPLIIHY